MIVDTCFNALVVGSMVFDSCKRLSKDNSTPCIICCVAVGVDANAI